MTNPITNPIPNPNDHAPGYAPGHTAGYASDHTPPSYPLGNAYTPPSYPPGNAYTPPSYPTDNPTADNPTADNPATGNPTANPYADPRTGPQANRYDARATAGQPHDAYSTHPPHSNGGPAASPFATAFASPPGAPPLDQPYYGCPPQEAALRFFRKYVTVSGRASRSEYWWWVLISFIVAFALRFLSGVTNGALGFLVTIWMLGTLVPGFAVAIRRLHDSNRPGWMVVTPYAMWFVGAIAVMGGAAGAIFGAVSMLDGSSGHIAVGAGGAAFLVGALVIIAGIVVNIVLMAAPTKPEGARFDGIH